MGILLESYGNFMEFLWNFYGNFYGNFIEQMIQVIISPSKVLLMIFPLKVWTRYWASFSVHGLDVITLFLFATDSLKVNGWNCFEYSELIWQLIGFWSEICFHHCRICSCSGPIHVTFKNKLLISNEIHANLCIFQNDIQRLLWTMSIVNQSLD